MYLLISYNIIYYYRAYLFLQIKIGGREGGIRKQRNEKARVIGLIAYMLWIEQVKNEERVWSLSHYAENNHLESITKGRRQRSTYANCSIYLGNCVRVLCISYRISQARVTVQYWTMITLFWHYNKNIWNMIFFIYYKNKVFLTVLYNINSWPTRQFFPIEHALFSQLLYTFPTGTAESPILNVWHLWHLCMFRN